MNFCYPYPRPAVTVDAVVFREMERQWQILLIQRKNEPFLGMWALPGGFVDMDETLEESAARELSEETGLSGIHLKQLHTFSAVDRDPRHRTITTVFMGILQDHSKSPMAGDDASAAAWFLISQLPTLAFDHKEVIEMAIMKL